MNQDEWSNAPGSSNSPHEPQRKRSSRACDECRKTKSRCNRDRGEDAPCASCTVAGIQCTFLDRSYKRGPPKGYIQAIELRLRQVESVLGTIVASPDSRAQSLLQDIRTDSLASHILERVDRGPFGPSGRSSHTQSILSHEAFLQAVTQPGPNVSRSPIIRMARMRRESRVDRENLSMDQETYIPTLAWQNQLLAVLHERAGLNNGVLDRTNMTASSSALPSSVGVPESPQSLVNVPFHMSSERTVLPPSSGQYPHFQTGHPTSQISGLIERERVTSANVLQNALVDIPIHTQLHLLDLYFAYVHPFFPAINNRLFSLEVHPSSLRSSFTWPAESAARDLLLLSMYTVASHFTDPRNVVLNGGIRETRQRYHAAAIKLCKDISHISNLMTCQALLILGYEESGLGSYSQAWSLIGMAIRMAQDLGLHSSAESNESYTPDQVLQRQRVWWTCIMMDKYVSIDTVRLPAICANMYDTQFPPDDQNEVFEMWCQRFPGTPQACLASVPCRPAAYFSTVTTLILIFGSIMDKIYALDANSIERRWKNLPMIRGELYQWFSRLPIPFRLDETVREPVYADILVLHMQYWAAILLLYRNFLPPPRSTRGGQFSISDIENEALTTSQQAARKITELTTMYDDNATLKTSPPFVSSCLRMAGMMHIFSLSLQPTDIEAQTLLERVMFSLKEIESVWTNASRTRQLLTEQHRHLVPSPTTSRGSSSGGFNESSSQSTRQQQLPRSYHSSRSAGPSSATEVWRTSNQHTSR